MKNKLNKQIIKLWSKFIDYWLNFCIVLCCVIETCSMYCAYVCTSGPGIYMSPAIIQINMVLELYLSLNKLTYTLDYTVFIMILTSYLPFSQLFSIMLHVLYHVICFQWHPLANPGIDGCTISGMEWWNGTLEWNTGMEYWNDPNCIKSLTIIPSSFEKTWILHHVHTMQLDVMMTYPISFVSYFLFISIWFIILMIKKPIMNIV